MDWGGILPKNMGQKSAVLFFGTGLILYAILDLYVFVCGVNKGLGISNPKIPQKPARIAERGHISLPLRKLQSSHEIWSRSYDVYVQVDNHYIIISYKHIMF